MTISINSLVIWLHLSAAVVWLGAIAFQALPFTRLFSGMGLEERARFVQRATRRVLPLAWASIVVLLLTGVWNTVYTPIAREPPITSLGELDALLPTAFGKNLLVKHFFVAATIFFTAWHNFILAPRLDFTAGGFLDRQWRLTLVVSVLDLIAAIGVLFFAAQVLFSLR